MPVYLIISEAGTLKDGADTSLSLEVRAVSAADLAAVAALVKHNLRLGLAGVREPLEIGVIRLNAAGTVVPEIDGTWTVGGTFNDTQPAIADLPSGAGITTLAQAISAIQTIGAKVNVMLAELRAAGVIAA